MSSEIASLALPVALDRFAAVSARFSDDLPADVEAALDVELEALERRLATGPVGDGADLRAKASYIRLAHRIDPAGVPASAIDTLVDGVNDLVGTAIAA